MHNNLSVNSSSRNGGIDALKGLCTIMVIITHIAWSTQQRRSFIFPYTIQMAVPIFLIIQTYLLAAAFERSGITGLKEAYRPSRIAGALVRFLVPCLIIVMLELLVRFCISSSWVHSFLSSCGIATSGIEILTPLTALEAFKIVLTGGKGNGSYYTPLLAQIVFLFPIIFQAVKRNPDKGLFVIFLVNLIYEIGKNLFGIRYGWYRLLAFRYLFMLAIGVYLYYKKNIPKVILLLSFIIGFSYVTLNGVTDYKPLVFTSWTKTSMITGLYIGPIMYFFFNLIDRQIKEIPILGKLGQASYNIFLVQMAYYYFAVRAMKVFMPSLYSNQLLLVLINVTICSSIGYLFYIIERPITKKISSWIQQKLS